MTTGTDDYKQLKHTARIKHGFTGLSQFAIECFHANRGDMPEVLAKWIRDIELLKGESE